MPIRRQFDPPALPLHPAFVLRRTHLATDLPQLLDAMQCANGSVSTRTLNVHDDGGAATAARDVVLQAVGEVDGARHVELERRARDENAHGARRVTALFAHSPPRVARGPHGAALDGEEGT